MRLELTALLLLNCATAFPRLELEDLPTAEQHPGAKVVVLLDELEAQFDGARAAMTSRASPSPRAVA